MNNRVMADVGGGQSKARAAKMLAEEAAECERQANADTDTES